MNWLEFYASLIDSLAWPGVVAFVVYVLKDRLGELIPKLRRFRHKDTELEFAQGVEELKQEAIEANVVVPENEEKAQEFQDQYKFLTRLSEISPRSTVLEAWRIVEGAAAKAIVRAYPEMQGSPTLSPVHMQKLLEGRVLSSSEWKQFNELRRLRNTAAHAEDFDLKGMPIEAYLDIALSTASRIENFNP